MIETKSVRRRLNELMSSPAGKPAVLALCLCLLAVVTAKGVFALLTTAGPGGGQPALLVPPLASLQPTTHSSGVSQAQDDPVDSTVGQASSLSTMKNPFAAPLDIVRSIARSNQGDSASDVCESVEADSGVGVGQVPPGTGSYPPELAISGTRAVGFLDRAGASQTSAVHPSGEGAASSVGKTLASAWVAMGAPIAVGSPVSSDSISGEAGPSSSATSHREGSAYGERAVHGEEPATGPVQTTASRWRTLAAADELTGALLAKSATSLAASTSPATIIQPSEAESQTTEASADGRWTAEPQTAELQTAGPRAPSRIGVASIGGSNATPKLSASPCATPSVAAVSSGAAPASPSAAAVPIGASAAPSVAPLVVVSMTPVADRFETATTSAPNGSWRIGRPPTGTAAFPYDMLNPLGMDEDSKSDAGALGLEGAAASDTTVVAVAGGRNTASRVASPADGAIVDESAGEEVDGISSQASPGAHGAVRQASATAPSLVLTATSQVNGRWSAIVRIGNAIRYAVDGDAFYDMKVVRVGDGFIEIEYDGSVFTYRLSNGS